MNEFLSDFWGIYIAIATIVSLVACAALLWMQSSTRVKVGADGRQGTTGHVWDETLIELDNPLPRWWMWLFYITIVFSLGYLWLYPGLGAFAGASGWSSSGQYDREMRAADERYGPIFEKYVRMPIEAVAADPQARAIGERLFLNTCAQCHGSDARGSKGFPNLVDADWLYGGTPAQIEASIKEGRRGVMPPMGAALGSGDDVRNVAEYVLSLSGSPHDTLKAQLGREKFAVCGACHGADGKGNQALGAPNLTDRIWLHGAGVDAIVAGINRGYDNAMPAHGPILGDAKVHLLAAYVWGLGRRP
jgi:cytochrome c oxidase cbb3-type subunit III